MRSAHGAGAPVRIIRSDDSSRALADFLHELSEAISSGGISPGAAGKVSVDVLGRYRFERDVLPRNVPVNLQVTFRTVHGSKGLEADFVVVPGMATGTYGFPSTIADDRSWTSPCPHRRTSSTPRNGGSSTWRSLAPAAVSC